MNKFNNTNPVNSIGEFEIQLVSQLNEYYKDYPLGTPRVQINKGNKFYKIIVGTAVWGFIARIPFVHKGIQLMKGDLMKPAGWSAVAKHARGNVIEGSASYGAYGPLYLK